MAAIGDNGLVMFRLNIKSVNQHIYCHSCYAFGNIKPLKAEEATQFLFDFKVQPAFLLKPKNELNFKSLWGLMDYQVKNVGKNGF